MNTESRREQKSSSYRWIVWGILVTIYLIVFFHRLSVGVITEDLKKAFGMTATQIANLGAMYFYAYTLMQIPTGILADSLGPKRTIITGSVIAGIGSILFSFSTNIPMAYFSRLLVGLGVSVVFLCILKIIAIWFPAKDFASMSGLTSFIGIMGGVLAQGPLIIIVGLIGWRSSFLTMGILTFALIVLVAIFVNNSPADIGLPEVNPQLPQDTGVSQSIWTQFLEVIKNPRVWCPALAFGGVNGTFILFGGTFGVSYIMYVYGLSKASAANFVSILLVVAGISFILSGKISDKIMLRKLPMIILASIATATWGILVFVKLQVWFMSIFVVLLGIASSIGVLCWSMGKEVSNPKLSGMAMSIVNVSGSLFAALLPVVCGKLIDFNNAAGLSPAMAYQKAFIVCVVSSGVGLVFALLSKETKCENIYKK